MGWRDAAETAQEQAQGVSKPGTVRCRARGSRRNREGAGKGGKRVTQ